MGFLHDIPRQGVRELEGLVCCLCGQVGEFEIALRLTRKPLRQQLIRYFSARGSQVMIGCSRSEVRTCALILRKAILASVRSASRQ